MASVFLKLCILLFFLFLSHPTPLVLSQLLPIIDEVGGIDPTKIPIYIVHVEKPLFDGGGTRRSLRLENLRNWYTSFLPNATLASGEPRMVYAYRDVISGFAARLTPDEAEAMESVDGVIAVYPEQEHYGSTTYTPSFLSLKGEGSSNILWQDSSMGAGQIIGVLDTGIDQDHPSFDDKGVPPVPSKWEGSCFWGNKRICNNKLIGAVAFRHGDHPEPNDSDGHGTHVASTAAGNFVDNANVIGQANGTASGMAPRAHLAIYKVLFKGSSGHSVATDADIFAAIDQAIHDHVDILQMSLGAPNIPLFRSSVAVGSFAAIAKGIVPCVSTGNAGPTESKLSNDAPWLLGVGAGTTDRRITSSVLLGNGLELLGESANQQSHDLPGTQLPLAFPFQQIGTKTSRGCTDPGELSKLDLSGKIVMCFRYRIADHARGRNVVKAGGSAMILMNDDWSGETTTAFAHVLPASHLGSTGAKLLIEYYSNTTNPTATINFKGTQFGISPSPAVASFSSRGPSVTNGGILKPDVIAPGVNILAAWPQSVGPTASTFNFLSGTSMATPHVSGVVALLRTQHPNWTPSAIKSAIMTTSYRFDRQGNPITDQNGAGAATAFARGAGHIDPQGAMNPGIIYQLNYDDYVNYLCGHYKDTKIVRMFTKNSSFTCAKVKAVAPEQLNYPSFSVGIGNANPEVSVTRTVTNVGDANSVYNVNVEEPDGISVQVSPETLEFNNVGEEKSFEVKFTLKEGLPMFGAGKVKDGFLRWDSGKYNVSSPIVIMSV